MTDKRRPFVIGEYYDSPADKQSFLREIFDKTAPYYEGIAKWGWFGSGGWYRRTALLRNGVTPGMRVIDVASGTGPVARALMEILDSPDQIVCVEPSAGMVAESKKTVPAVHYQSTAENLPVPDQSFDYLTMGFALRHVDNLDDSFREFRRVLKEGGTVLIMDVTIPKSTIGKALFTLYFKYLLPWFSGLFSWDRNAYRLMRYYWDTMDQMTDREEVASILRESGFKSVTHNIQLGCFSEYVGKR